MLTKVVRNHSYGNTPISGCRTPVVTIIAGFLQGGKQPLKTWKTESIENGRAPAKYVNWSNGDTANEEVLIVYPVPKCGQYPTVARAGK